MFFYYFDQLFVYLWVNSLKGNIEKKYKNIWCLKKAEKPQKIILKKRSNHIDEKKGLNTLIRFLSLWVDSSKEKKLMPKRS